MQDKKYLSVIQGEINHHFQLNINVEYKMSILKISNEHNCLINCFLSMCQITWQYDICSIIALLYITTIDVYF